MKFEKGWAGGPGRPKGSRNKLSEDFLRDAHNAWQDHGVQALKVMAQDEPSKFVQVIASIVPKQDQLDIVHHLVARMPEDPVSFEDWERKYAPRLSSDQH